MPNMSSIFENDDIIQSTEAINYNIVYTIGWNTKDSRDIRG